MLPFQSWFLKKIIRVTLIFCLVCALFGCDNASQNNHSSNRAVNSRLEDTQKPSGHEQSNTHGSSGYEDKQNQAVDMGGIPIHPDLPEEHTNNSE